VKQSPDDPFLVIPAQETVKESPDGPFIVMPAKADIQTFQ